MKRKEIELLQWIHERLIKTFGEKKDTTYMVTFAQIIEDNKPWNAKPIEITESPFLPYSLYIKLKEKGFATSHSFGKYTGITHQAITVFNQMRPEDLLEDAPLLYQVTDWLREVKKIHIEMTLDDVGWVYELFNLVLPAGKDQRIYLSYYGYETYHEALIKGIEETIDRL